MRTSQHTRRKARHLFASCLVRGRPDTARVRLVTRGVAGSARRERLAVLLDFERLVRLDRDRHTAVVESATRLPQDVRNDIRTALARRYGAGLETLFAENAELIAGVRITVGGDVYDGSVRGRLAAIEEGL